MSAKNTVTDAHTIEETSTPDFLWGANNIGRAIGLNPRQTHHLLINGDIKCAKKVRDRWVANRQALIREFGGTP